MPGRWRHAALGLALACGGGGLTARADDPPPLEPPATLPPLTVPTPDPDLPAALPEIPLENRPILAVPGLSAARRPVGRAPVASAPPAPAITPPAGLDPLPDGPPPLVAPSDTMDPPGVRPAPLRAQPARRGGSLSLEPVPADSLDPLKPAPRPRGGLDAGDDEPKARPVSPPPRRRLLGLFARPTPGRPPGDEPIRVEPRDDPAADAALKRRIETQVRRAVGDKTRAIDVRVVDRKIYIRAQVARFWQKRAVRRTLETLPALSGYKTVVDVVE